MGHAASSTTSAEAPRNASIFPLRALISALSRRSAPEGFLRSGAGDAVAAVSVKHWSLLYWSVVLCEM